MTPKHECTEIATITEIKTTYKFMAKDIDELKTTSKEIVTTLNTFIEKADRTFATKEENNKNAEKIEKIEKEQGNIATKVYIIVVILSAIGTFVYGIAKDFISNFIVGK